MLILSRHRDESVVLSIDGKVIATVTVTKIVGDRAWLGFDAPPEVVIHRQEIHELVEREARDRDAAQQKGLPS